MTQIESRSQDFMYDSPNLDRKTSAAEGSNLEKSAESKSWLKRHKNKIMLGGAAVAFALTLPQMSETVDGIKENAEWAIPAIVVSELAWNLGAAAMIISAGQKMGNPLKLKARVKEISKQLSDNKLFRAGMSVNIAGAAGTSLIIAAGSVAELPASTWPGAFLVAGASLAPSIAIWKGVYGRKEDHIPEITLDEKKEIDSTKPNVIISSGMFKDNEDMHFWVGEIADKSEIYNKELYDAQLEFRANVYVKQMQFLDDTHLDLHGYEIDSDDKRSSHITVAENLGDSLIRVVGSARLIEKTDENDLLPIEKYFPEIFKDKPLPTNAVEVSRFIARHEEDMVQHAVALSVIRALTFRSVSKKVEADYCIIEEPLMKLLQMIGVPIEQLGDPKDIDEYGGRLYPIRINPYNVLDSVTSDVSGTIVLKRFFGKEIENKGNGFYPIELTGGR